MNDHTNFQETAGTADFIMVGPGLNQPATGYALNSLFA